MLDGNGVELAGACQFPDRVGAGTGYVGCANQRVIHTIPLQAGEWLRVERFMPLLGAGS